jgi:hypothetical protein
MEHEQPFTKTFEDVNPAELQWEEAYRRNLKQSYGLDVHRELPERVKKALPPECVGDEFGYNITLKDIMRFSFGQRINKTNPLSNQQYLLFFFGVPHRPDNELGDLDPELAEKKFMLNTGVYSHGKYWVKAQNQNTGMIEVDYFKPNSLSAKGKAFVNDLLTNEPKITQIKGMKPEDLEILVDSLKKIREKLFSERIDITSWQYA